MFFSQTMKAYIIDPSNVDSDPVKQFQSWYEDYLKNNPKEPTAMHLSTADKNGRPAGRVVLLKSYDAQGFVFFTNYESQKGRDLAENPWCQLTFYWPEVHRQVRVYGEVRKVSAEESDEYFASRPFESCVGAWASRQGQVLKNRDELIKRVEELAKKYSQDKIVPRPPHWGGYRVVPDRVEFWQGRDNRIHDRVEYVKEGAVWKRQRLSP